MVDHQGTLGRTLRELPGTFEAATFFMAFCLGLSPQFPIAGLLGLPGDVLRSVSVSPGRKQISCKRQELKFGAAFLIWVCLKMERDVRYPSNFHSKHEDKPWDFWAPYLQTNPFLVCSMSCLELQSDKLRLFGCDETGQLTEEGESLRDHIKLNHSFDSCFIAISVPFHTISCEILMNYWRSKRESPFNSCWFAGRDLINYHRFLRLWRPRWHWWPWWPWERSGLGVWLLCASHIDTWFIHIYPSFVIFWWAFVIIQCFRRILWSH